ncbi:hypothetical protein MBLNU230_g6212t1 [Neophaeotheca triangularis]
MPVRRTRPAMYNTPHIRNGGFGALQVEAITNRPLSIARRHLAASQLRMRDIEPDELSSSDWVRFLVMEERERERWMTEFRRQRRNSDESSSSTEIDRDTAHLKAEEARQEALESSQRTAVPEASSSMPRPVQAATSNEPTAGRTPAVSIWARYFDEDDEAGPSTQTRAGRPTQQRAVTTSIVEAPPAYHSVVRARTPPPAYQPPVEGAMSPPYQPEDPHSPRSPRSRSP